MIDSWAVVNNESVKKETHFDPLIPNQNVINERMGLHNNGPSRDDYQKYGCACPKDSKQEQKQHLIDMMRDDEELGLYDVSKYVSSGGEKYVFGTAKGEYTIGITSPNTAKGEYGLAIGFNPETANTAYDHHSIVIGNGLTTTEPYQLLVDRNGIKIDKIMTMEEYELLSQVLKSINDIKF